MIEQQHYLVQKFAFLNESILQSSISQFLFLNVQQLKALPAQLTDYFTEVSNEDLQGQLFKENLFLFVKT